MSSVLAILCVLANTIPRWGVVDGDIFCKWQALSFVLMGVGAINRGKSKQERIIWDWCVLLSINNLIDELFGVASEVSLFEIMFAIAVTVWTGYRIKQCH